jgi:hypothetical protein
MSITLARNTSVAGEGPGVLRVEHGSGFTFFQSSGNGGEPLYPSFKLTWPYRLTHSHLRLISVYRHGIGQG